MGKRLSLIKSFFSIAFMLIGLVAFTQVAPGESRTTSYFTHLYRINVSQAELILKKGLDEVDESFFDELAYTYPTDSIQTQGLAFGHYLEVMTLGNQVEYKFLSVSNVEIRTLKNGTDLNLVVFDLNGNEVNDATVQLNRRKIKYDDTINGFRLKKNNSKGVIRVNYEGATSFFGLEREIRYSKFRRSFNSVVYSVPLKYVTVPVKLVIKSPYDLYHSIKRRYPQGIFYYTSKPFADIVRSISWGDPQGFVRTLACIFEKYHCKEKDYSGFVVFNKPKYRPGDTVKIKAYILDHKERLIDDEIQLWIGSQWWLNKRESKRLTALNPYQPGFYESSFVLHDSLDLKLDYEQKIYLANEEQSILRGTFYFEDYELDDSEFFLKLSKDQIYPEDSLQVYVEGKDANGLNIKDASVEVEIKPGVIHEISPDSLYIDNSIWSTSKPLDPSGETQIDIPVDIFYDAEIEYDVVATFRTADFETHSKVKGFRYRLEKPVIDYSIEGDSLNLNLSIGDSAIATNAIVMGHGSHRIVDSIQISLPNSVRINPLVSTYSLLANEFSKVVFLDELPSNVEVSANRDKDSLHVQLTNPRRLSVRYFLYK